SRDWSSDVCSSDLEEVKVGPELLRGHLLDDLRVAEEVPLLEVVADEVVGDELQGVEGIQEGAQGLALGPLEVGLGKALPAEVFQEADDLLMQPVGIVGLAPDDGVAVEGAGGVVGAEAVIDQTRLVQAMVGGGAPPEEHVEEHV